MVTDSCMNNQLTLFPYDRLVDNRLNDLAGNLNFRIENQAKMIK